MFLKNLPLSVEQKRQTLAFTLAEVVMSIAIAAIVFGGIILAYVQSTRRAEWSGYSLAAQALAVQQLEQARSAIWDPPLRNFVTNLNLTWISANPRKGYSWGILDLPITTNGVTVIATNYVTITMITNVGGVPGVSLQMVRVDTVWPFQTRQAKLYFTNTIATYLAPDNRDPDSL